MVVSCIGPRKDDSMVFIYTNWFLTCCSTEECWETVLGLVTEFCVVLSDHMLISILSVSVEPLEMLHAEAVEALAPQDLKPEDFLSPLHLICVFITLQEVKFILIIQFCISVISLLGRSNLDCVSSLQQVLLDSNQVLHTLTDSLQLLANFSHKHSFLTLSLK